MGTQRTSFDKLQRDRAKKAKAAAKREKRLDKSPDDEALDDLDRPAPPEGGELSAQQLLVEIERLHKDFESKSIDFETFEERKEELLARLPID